MLPAKLTLSEEERELMMNARFILTKNAVLEQMEGFFGQLCNRFREQVAKAGFSDAELFITNPKISKGEQYQQLPWVMLDYPRLFSKTDTCAIRCFFWWGQYWSITLQLSGRFLSEYQQDLVGFVNDRIDEPDWYVSAGDDPWRHDLHSEHYLPITAITQHYWQEERSYLKLAKKIPLEEWDQIVRLMEDNFSALIAILNHQAPRR
ncbi:MAG: hypothetical protein ACN4EP_13665 [Sediminibacterium sp.]